jgi:hypothetical protein
LRGEAERRVRIQFGASIALLGGRKLNSNLGNAGREYKEAGSFEHVDGLIQNAEESFFEVPTGWSSGWARCLAGGLK